MPRRGWSTVALLLPGLLVIPFVINQNTWFEWANAIWLLKLQTAYVRAHGVPTFFVSGTHQVFYPVHLYYAGPLFTILAYPSVVFGAWPVFVVATGLAFVGLAVGVYWLARSLSVPRNHAVAPALLFATTPYIVSDLYGRGAWTELLALAAASMTVGATAATLSSARRRGRYFVILVASSFLLVGAHNITLLWTALVSIPLSVLLSMALRLPARVLSRRFASAGFAVLLGVALSGCFLIPNLALGQHTLIGQPAGTLSKLRSDHEFETPRIIFSPVLSQPRTIPASDLHTQTASVAIIWIAVVLVGLHRKIDRRTLMEIAAVGLVAGGFAVLVVRPDWWTKLPSFVWATQFTFRLVPFLTLVLLVGVVLLLRLPDIRNSRWATLALVLAVGWQAGLALDQSLSASPRGVAPYPAIRASEVSDGSVPNSFIGFQQEQFKLVSGTPLDRPDQAALAPVRVQTPPKAVSLSGPQRAGSLVATNVVYSPLVTATGQAKIIGRDKDGYTVLQIRRHDTPVWTAKLSGACPLCLDSLMADGQYLPLVVGQILTIVAVATLFTISARGICGWRKDDYLPPRGRTTYGSTTSLSRAGRQRRCEVESQTGYDGHQPEGIARPSSPESTSRSLTPNSPG